MPWNTVKATICAIRPASCRGSPSSATSPFAGAFPTTPISWIYSVSPSNTANPTGLVRHTVTITLFDDQGGTGPSWELINAWPVGYTVPDLNGMGGEVAIQSLELCHEGLEHTPGGMAGEPSGG